uniref:Ion_trans_2 domain-containing protein n=2 Tax=Schistosoma mansoni TaxID=6183 RepID=A0A5K4F850_SCHMA
MSTNSKDYESYLLYPSLYSSQKVKVSVYPTCSTITDPFRSKNNHYNNQTNLSNMSYVNSIVSPSQRTYFNQQSSFIPTSITNNNNLSILNIPITSYNNKTLYREDTIHPSVSNINVNPRKTETILCLKRLFTFLLSHVGLAVLVIIYTVIGGSIFYAVEREHESEIKLKMFEKRTILVKDLILEWRNSQLELLNTILNHVNIIQQFEQTNFGKKFNIHSNLYDSIEHLTIINSLDNKRYLFNELKDEQKQQLSGLSWYLSTLGWPKRILPQWWFHRNYTQFMNLYNTNVNTHNERELLSKTITDDVIDKMSDNSNSILTDSVNNPNEYNLTTSSLLNTTNSMTLVNTRTQSITPLPVNDTLKSQFKNDSQTDPVYFSTNLIHSLPKHFIILTKLDDILPIILNKSFELENNLQNKLAKYVEQIVVAIKDEGWNGSEHKDDFNWTFEGSILFAVTIITTIGYGHVTPHTRLGKFLTMMYAVFGIPLFFCYLSNSGNYMASLFQVFYIRICQPAFIQFKKCIKKCFNPLTHKKVTQQLKLSQNQDSLISERNNSTLSSSNLVKYKRYKRTLGNTTHNHSISSNKICNDNNNNHLYHTYHSHNYANYNPNDHLNYKNIEQSNLTWNDKQSQTSSSRLSSYKPDYFMETIVSTIPYINTKNYSTQRFDFNDTYSLNPYLQQHTPLESFDLSNYYSNTTRSIYDQSFKESINTSNNLELHSSMNVINIDHQLKQQLQQQQQRQNDLDIRHCGTNESNKSSNDTIKTVPISLTILMMTFYILLGAAVFCLWESTDYLKWSYFCFVTLSTIGFGDIVPGTKIDSQNPKEKMIALAVYVALGLSLFAMCFNLMEEEVTAKMKRIGRRIGVTNSEKKKSKS